MNMNGSGVGIPAKSQIAMAGSPRLDIREELVKLQFLDVPDAPDSAHFQDSHVRHVG
jgi:hypothetical protein